MKTTIRATANMFGISQLGVWSLVRQDRIGVSLNRAKRSIVDTDEIKALFEKEPKLYEELKRKKR